MFNFTVCELKIKMVAMNFEVLNMLVQNGIKGWNYTDNTLCLQHYYNVHATLLQK